VDGNIRDLESQIALAAIKPKGLNKIAKTSKYHLRRRTLVYITYV
jgi:hypothetical protein